MNSTDFHDTDVKSVDPAPPQTQRVNPDNDRTHQSMESHYPEQATNSKVSMTSDGTFSITPYFPAQPSSTVFNPTGKSFMYIYCAFKKREVPYLNTFLCRERRPGSDDVTAFFFERKTTVARFS